MKHIYTTLIVLFISIASFGGKISSVKNGGWGTADTWSLNNVPRNGDSIIIPSDLTVTLNGLDDLDNVIIVIYGTLDLGNGKLRLNDASRVIIETTGRLTGQNNNDQLTIGGEFKFKGSGVPQTGYSYADNTTGVYPNGFVLTTPSTLPVTFQSFYVARQGSNIQLNWVTSEEVNNKYYEVERSTDGRSWKQLAIILGAGTTSLISKYAYTDKNVTDAAVYYRIRQTDMNGAVHYSAIRTIRSSEKQQVANIYASSKQTITVDFNSDVKNNVTIQVISMNGHVVARQHFKQASYRLNLNVMNAGAGVYAVQVSDGNGWSEVKKITL
jgi:hypothetical protein